MDLVEVPQDNIRRRVILYLWLRARMRRRNPRRCWVREIFVNREQNGHFYTLLPAMRIHDRQSHHTYLRMSPEMFDYILGLIGPLIQRRSISRSAIPAGLKLALTLRYLATGDNMTSQTFNELVSGPSVSGIILETCQAIWDQLQNTVLPIPTAERWKTIGDEFFRAWQFPNCVGAIDGKHVVIQAPGNAGSTFFNYKGTHSIVLMAASDANYMLTLVDIGASGRQSDGGVFQNSGFGQAIIDQTLPLPQPLQLDGLNLPSVFVADAAFPLRPNLLRPYPGRFLPDEQTIFNYRLSRARRIIENLFGIMAARWRIYRRPILAKLVTVEAIVKATCCLHNFLQWHSNNTREPNEQRYCPPGLTDYEDDNGVLHPGLWRNEQMDGLRELGQMGSNNCSQEAKHIRDRFGTFFFNRGQVPWQWRKLPNFYFDEDQENEDVQEDDSE